MKLEIRMESELPIIFFCDIEYTNRKIQCYTKGEEHSTASRAYMRSLRKPKTPEELNLAWDLLKHYANLPRF